jgi:CheY-like chemotaxis protein
MPPNQVEFFCEVRDSGIGIPEDKQDYIFNKFSQADGTTTRKFGGTGLGLAISKDLCRMMGGSIGVRSKLGEGSTFWFTMVLEKNHNGRKEAIAALSEPHALKDAGSNEQKAFDKNTALHNVRILLAEDNIVNQRVAVKMLQKYGCEVVAVQNGQQALHNFQHSGPFDIIIMDCQMPIMDGYEATQTIRELEKKYGWRHMPVIAFTAHALKGDDQKCFQAGMDDYITKPISISELERILMRWISANKRIDCVHETKEIDEVDDALDDKIFMRFYKMVEDEMESLIESHREATRDYFKMLRTSLEIQNFSEISKAAHTIKSSHANFGAMKTVRLAREIETHARTEMPDITMLCALAQELEKEARRVDAAISRKMSNGG